MLLLGNKKLEEIEQEARADERKKILEKIEKEVIKPYYAKIDTSSKIEPETEEEEKASIRRGLKDIAEGRVFDDKQIEGISRIIHTVVDTVRKIDMDKFMKLLESLKKEAR